jgi:hypothetical protein
MIKIKLPPYFYPFRHYDAYFRLKIPLRLWLIIAYSLFHPFMNGGILLHGRAESISVDFRFGLIFPGLVAIPVVASAVWRKATATPWQKQLWHKSHLLLLLSLGFSIAFFSFVHFDFLSDFSHEKFLYCLSIVFFNSAVFFYILFSRFIRDVFIDFPEKHDTHYWYMRIFSH